MIRIFSAVHRLVWGVPVLVLILGVGIFLTVRLGFVQVKLFPAALKRFCAGFLPGKAVSEESSSFRALCTALGATVGTGNLVGVAGAICIGGPGAVFWMWLCGFLGMAVKFAETILAIHFRIKTGDGYAGGPMYVITRGLGEKFRPMAYLYSLFGLLAAFGVGNAAQINAVIGGINGILAQSGVVQTPERDLLIGAVLAVLVGLVLLGGAGRIGAAAELLVPFAALGYILLCTGVLFACRQKLPLALLHIFQGAWDPKSVTGGALGSAFVALRVGCSRGIFTNEAGMGTASIAHAGARVAHPVEQGLMGMVEVFLDTIVICTLTALVILVSDVPIPYGMDKGSTLATSAFSCVYGKLAPVLIGLILCALAVATLFGWGLYGARCAQFLFGSGAWKWFAAAQMLMVLAASAMDTAFIWQISEIFNGLMAIPNLITLAALSREAVRLTKEYKKSGASVAGGGMYANFHQRKPL